MIRLYLIFFFFYSKKMPIFFSYITSQLPKLVLWILTRALDSKQVDCSGKELPHLTMVSFHLMQWCHLQTRLHISTSFPERIQNKCYKEDSKGCSSHRGSSNFTRFVLFVLRYIVKTIQSSYVP